MIVLHGVVGLKLKAKKHKQNTVIRTIFFATTRGKDTESTFPFVNFLNILSVTSIFKLQALKVAHRWHSKALSNIFDNYFQYPSDIIIVMIQDMLVIKIFISRAKDQHRKPICFFNNCS